MWRRETDAKRFGGVAVSQYRHFLADVRGKPLLGGLKGVDRGKVNGELGRIHGHQQRILVDTDGKEIADSFLQFI